MDRDSSKCTTKHKLCSQYSMLETKSEGLEDAKRVEAPNTSFEDLESTSKKEIELRKYILYVGALLSGLILIGILSGCSLRRVNTPT